MRKQTTGKIWGSGVEPQDKPIRYRINRRGTQVVDFDPTCVRTFYNIDQLKLLEDNKTGES